MIWPIIIAIIGAVAMFFYLLYGFSLALAHYGGILADELKSNFPRTGKIFKLFIKISAVAVFWPLAAFLASIPDSYYP